MGADNTAYQRNAISLGKENQSGMTFAEYQASHPGATEDEWKNVYAWTTAIGVTNKILGQGAVGLGNSNEVYDQAGIGIGHTNRVRGAFSVGIGRANKINHNFAYGLGDGNSTEFQSILIGWNNTSKQDYDVILGRNNSIKGIILGNSNTGDGSGIVLGNSNTLNGSEDYIIGKNNTTDGSKQSITFGHDNTSQSGYGVTFGAYNTNKGNYNLVGGGGKGSGPNNTTSSIENSIMYGAGLYKVGGQSSAIFGQYNTKNRIDAIFEIGNGTSDTDRSNAFEVLKDGRAKVFTPPKDANDVVRKLELDPVIDRVNSIDNLLNEEIIRAQDEEKAIKFNLNELESNIFDKVSKEYINSSDQTLNLSMRYDRATRENPSLYLSISTPKNNYISINDSLYADTYWGNEVNTPNYTVSKTNVKVDKKVDYDDFFYLRVYGDYDFIFSSINKIYSLDFRPRLNYQLIPKKTILVIKSITAYNYGPGLIPNNTPLSYSNGVLEGGLLFPNYDNDIGTSSIYLIEHYNIYFSNMLI